MSPAADTEALLRQVIDTLSSARPLPLSSGVKLERRDEVLATLEQALASLPEELRAARRMLKEREELLERTGREAEDIIDAARQRAERMVQRAEIVRQAEHAARRTVGDARDEARRLRLEAEEYCDAKLAGFEELLERTLKTVAAGRAKLAVTPSPLPPDVRIGDPPADGLADASDVFFDQDRA